MNIVRKDIDSLNAVISVSIEQADYSEKVETKLREYRKKANIPGFRPGMVPLGLLKKMYGKSVIAEEVNGILSDNLYKYIQENEIKLLGEPLPSETEQKEIDFSSETDFEFTFDIGIAPEFEVSLSAKDKIKYYLITPGEEMVDNRIKSYASRYGKYIQEESVAEKDIVKGTLIELSEGKEKEGGIQVEEAVLTPAYMQDETYKASFIGAKIGDTITFNPKTAFENDTEVSSLLKISKEEAAVFNGDVLFTIENITRYHEAEINQELFDKVYGEGVVKSTEEFTEKIKSEIRETLEQDSEYKFGIDAREFLLKKYDDLAFPDAFLKRWLMATNKNMTQETLDTDYPKMIADLKWQLIKDKISKAHNVNIEKEDVEDFGRKIARSQFAQYGMLHVEDAILDNYVKDMLKREESFKNIVDKVAENKVLDIIKKTVKINTKEVSIEEFNKMFE